MRKLLWIVVLSFTAFVGASSSGGCSGAAVASSLCDDACTIYNADLHCVGICNCGACASAPPACDSYFQCVKTFAGTCLQLAVNCPVPTDCQPFISANCN